ncbi:MAG: hypothetical protein NT010_09155 [Proteobacteria bacterium]|nr:hypothetical protein [Pseudomonadota bacterium]
MSKACPEDNPNRLFILGVIHRDDKGAELLREWLVNIAPEVITLEFSNYGLEFRKERGMEYKKRLEEILNKIKVENETYDREALSRLFAYINMPYEYEVVSGYAQEHDALFYLIDMDDFSYLKLQQIDELFEENNIRQLLYGNDGAVDSNEKAIAKLFFEKGIKLFTYTDEMYVRDKHMSNMISTLMKHHMHKKFLHICGWQHLQDPYGLYAQFNPGKAFFYDKAFCV